MIARRKNGIDSAMCAERVSASACAARTPAPAARQLRAAQRLPRRCGLMKNALDLQLLERAGNTYYALGEMDRSAETYDLMAIRAGATGSLRHLPGSVVPAASPNDLVIRLPYRPPYDWPAIAAFAGTRNPGRRVRLRQPIHTHDRDRPRARRRCGGNEWTRPSVGDPLSAARVSAGDHRTRAAHLRSPPTLMESTPIWLRIRRSPRSWQGGPGYACPVHGTNSSSPCAPCSANRLRFARRWAWQHSSYTVM
jgi:hypothetical protein